MRDETQDMLSDIPEEPYSTPGSGYFKIPEANAFVCRDSQGRIGIYPVTGGWLGANVEAFDGDVAPFCD